MHDKYFLIQTESVHQITYLVKADSIESAKKMFEQNEFPNDPQEITQEWVGENVVSINEAEIPTIAKLNNIEVDIITEGEIKE